MLTNGLPACLNFSLVSGKEMLLEIAIDRGESGVGELLTYTFSGQVLVPDGEAIGIEGWVSETESNVIVLRIPALAEGTYKYALSATGQTGETSAFLAGTIGAWWGAIEEQTEPIYTPNARCTVHLPGKGRATAHWRLTTRVVGAVLQAEQWCKDAQEAAERAEAAANSVNGSLQVKLLGEVNEALKEFDENIQNAIRPDANTNTWWIAGKDTHVQVTGDRGRDGLDGTTIRRVLLGEGEELPLPKTEAEAEKLRGTFYVQHDGDDYSVFTLLETTDGQYEWVDIGETNLPATETLYGLVKLGTNAVLTGAPVGCDSNNQLTVGTATTLKHGVVKIGSNLELDADGALNAKAADFSNPGIVIKDKTLVVRASQDVPTTEAVRAWLEQHYYSREQTYTSEQVYKKDETYAKDAVYTKEEVDKLIPASGSQSPFVVLTEEEYLALDNPKPGVLYLIPEA